MNSILGNIVSLLIALWYIFIGLGLLYTFYVVIAEPIYFKIKEWINH